VVRIRVTRSADGCLAELIMEGHVSAAGGTHGANIVCAAVTGLIRSCADAIVAAGGIEAAGTAESEGAFRLAIRSASTERREWLRGVTDVLIAGVRRMADETPDEVSLLDARADGQPG
jgi:uncharacterized protein YsxB (DUF464 family)